MYIYIYNITPARTSDIINLTMTIYIIYRNVDKKNIITENNLLNLIH